MAHLLIIQPSFAHHLVSQQQQQQQLYPSKMKLVAYGTLIEKKLTFIGAKNKMDEHDFRVEMVAL